MEKRVIPKDEHWLKRLFLYWGKTRTYYHFKFDSIQDLQENNNVLKDVEYKTRDIYRGFLDNLTITRKDAEKGRHNSKKYFFTLNDSTGEVEMQTWWEGGILSSLYDNALWGRISNSREGDIIDVSFVKSGGTYLLGQFDRHDAGDRNAGLTEIIE